MPPTGTPARVTPFATRTGGAAPPPRTGAVTATTMTVNRSLRITSNECYLRRRKPRKSLIRVSKKREPAESWRHEARNALQRSLGRPEDRQAPPRLTPERARRGRGVRPGATPRRSSLRDTSAETERTRRKRMPANELHETARALVAEGKGILAADESDSTI